LADHRFIDISREFLKAGFSRNEVLGATDVELGLWCNDATRCEFWQRLQTHGYVRYLRADLRAKGGRVVPYTVSAVVTELSQGFCVIWETRNIEALIRGERALLADREAAEAVSIDNC